jgi:hypothetical protein
VSARACAWNTAKKTKHLANLKHFIISAVAGPRRPLEKVEVSRIEIEKNVPPAGFCALEAMLAAS